MKDQIIAKGTLDIKIIRANGRSEIFKVDNLVVTVGRAHIADQLAAQLQAQMGYMAIGSGTTAADAANTALETEISRKTMTVTQGTGADANKIVYYCEWAAGEGTGDISEAGMFNAAAAGTMLSRTVFPVKAKGDGDSLSIQWTVTISG